MLDQIALEQFFKDINDVHVFVREESKTSTEAAMLTDNYFQKRKLEGGAGQLGSKR